MEICEVQEVNRVVLMIRRKDRFDGDEHFGGTIFMMVEWNDKELMLTDTKGEFTVHLSDGDSFEYDWNMEWE